MHFLVVSLQVVVSREALAALGAFEHPLSSVQHLMSLETLRAAEAFAALGAAVGPDARVLLLVPLQIPRLAKALPAVGAQVGFLSGVRPEVHVELPGVREALGAVGAAVRLLARVDALVLLEAVVVREAFPAVGAQVQDLHLLEARVRFKRFGGGAALPAVRAFVLVARLVLLRRRRAGVGLAPRHVLHGVVPLDVFDEVALHGEGELTVGTREELGRAVILGARVALLVLLEVSGRGEDLVAVLAAVGLGLLVRRLLVSPQERRLGEGRPALSARVLPRRTRVSFEVVRVVVRPFAAIAAKPLVLGVGAGGGLPLAARRRFAAVRPSLRSYELRYSRNLGPGSEALRPSTGESLDGFHRLGLRRLWDEVGVAALSGVGRRTFYGGVTLADVLLERVHRRKGQRTLGAAEGQRVGLVCRGLLLPPLWFLVAAQVPGQVVELAEALLTRGADVRTQPLVDGHLVLFEGNFICETLATA